MIASAKSVGLTPLVFRIYGVDGTNLPTTNNQHYGIASINQGESYGSIVCMTFDTNVYVKSLVGGTWSEWVRK